MSFLPADEEHPLSEKTTNTDDQKLETTIAAVTDPTFPLPTLKAGTSTFRYVRSFTVLFCLLASGLGGAYLFEAAILQDPLYLAVASVAVLVGVFATGTVWIDWWELVLGYWWLSMPIGCAAGLAFVMMQERATTWGETS